MSILAVSSGLITAIEVILGLILIGALTTLGLCVYEFIKKEEDVHLLFTKNHQLIFISVAVSSVVSFLLFLPLILKTSSVGASFLMGAGALLLGLSVPTFVATFVLHYYKLNIVKVGTKISKIVLYVSAVVSFIALFMLLDGLTYGGYVHFPLVKGIPFDDPLVAFYALLILTGALISYFLSDHEFYKTYGKHGVLENIFYVAFPAGIIGSRLWYVIGEWESGGFKDNPLTVFAIRDGGLAIMGGAIFGILAGVIFFVKRRKEYNPLLVVDFIIPTILLAQALGRWGNFFNQEVYGMTIANIDNWWFIPAFVKEQMFILGEYRQPFFLIESLLNVTGYFVIRYAFGEGLKKYRKPLDLAFMYLVWYGLVRFIMEPLRDPSFRMGKEGNWSYINALIFLLVGVALIVINHFVDFNAKYEGFKAKQALKKETTNE